MLISFFFLKLQIQISRICLIPFHQIVLMKLFSFFTFPWHITLIGAFFLREGRLPLIMPIIGDTKQNKRVFGFLLLFLIEQVGLLHVGKVLLTRAHGENTVIFVLPRNDVYLFFPLLEFTPMKIMDVIYSLIRVQG
jgi:hypothetical protein